FSAKLAEHNGKKITIGSKEQNDEIVAALANNDFTVGKIDEKERTKKAYAPFTTSSLQQEASIKLNFSTKKTMQVAQQLYEGVEVKGHGTIGLVTYIRTDSVRISGEAVAAAAAYVEANYGKQYLGNNIYSNKKKDVQDAHEAIRPSYVDMSPDSIKESLTKDQFNLYKLIWSRFVASRMSDAVFDSVSAEILNGEYTFKAVGSKLKFNGFLKVYKDIQKDDEDKLLPKLNSGEKLKLSDLQSEQNFTQPPSRFTEASLVKDLEEKNIGRPSTYAPIIATLLDRKYASKDKKTLVPTELGFIVTELMEKYFNEIVDAGFTAELEDKLDDVEIKNADWKGIIDEFYGTLKGELEVADSEIEKVVFEDQLSGDMCELCGKPMAIKHGRFGEFLACTGYPDCKNTKPIVSKIDVKCPACGQDIVKRKGKSGKIFYGCSGYPQCNQVYWNKPVNKACKECGSLLVEKKLKSSTLSCSNSECKYKE
ncbi:MAG: type I DNA topoisomerase, partial [Clostridiales bacterium]|nr:type I DNA topoisomerase [Clostridiales bacterium]